jgi:hypothetical protein
VKVDTHELEQLAAEFERVKAEILVSVAKVTGMACNNMKKDAQRRVAGFPHLPHLARSFNYDVKTLASTVVGEVGSDSQRLQGKLDVFIEYGTPTSAPIPHWAPAADKEVPVWIHYLERAAAEVLGD